MKDDHQLDAAIDRAVREMMSVEPRPGMRQRVLGRLRQPHRRTFPFRRLAVAGVSAAIVLIALRGFIGTNAPQPRPDNPVVQSQSQPAPSPAPKPVEPPPLVAVKVEKVAPPAPREIPEGVVVAQSVNEPVAASMEVAPLAPTSSLTIQRLETPAPSVSEIVLKAIPISDLSIEPLQGISQ
jgi:hypothetical protein